MFVVVVLTAVKKVTTMKYYTETELHAPLVITAFEGNSNIIITGRAKIRDGS